MSRKLAIGLAVLFSLLALNWAHSAYQIAGMADSTSQAGEGYGDYVRAIQIRAGAAGATAFALAAFIVLSRREQPPKLVTALEKLPTTTVVCGLLAVFALISTVTFAGHALETNTDLALQEDRLLEIKRELEDFKFDANGQVAPSQRSEFASLLTDAKYQPGIVNQLRDNRLLESSICGGSLLATIGLALVALRRTKKARASMVTA